MAGIVRNNVPCGSSAVVREDCRVAGEAVKRQGTICSDAFSEEYTSIMKRWHDAEWIAHDRGRSIVDPEFQDSDSSGNHHPDNAGEQTVLVEDVDCEQENTPHSPHRWMLREVEYVNTPVLDE